nr:MAG TPA: hypothetical protein [Caudoviricetes sp.]DAH37735.1 MAG TPA: hypothetical protein [Caudoviricetes sp.]DAJ73369.1 MAG TPA: hypothetical protein [Caudoviricetes sp.]DAP66648.1 MAG TPA: hypothetical protein [Caudoviricetes sp.]
MGSLYLCCKTTVYIICVYCLYTCILRYKWVTR